MLHNVIERLEQLGFEVSFEQEKAVLFELNKVQEYIKESCGIEEIPESFFKVVIERACGGFLFSLKNSGKLETIDYESIIKEIDEGDVKVIFDSDAVLSDEQKADKLIDYLMSYGESMLLSLRCIKW